MASHYTRASVTTLHDFGRCVGTTALGHFLLGLSQFHGHGSWLVALGYPPPLLWHRDWSELW